jgi:hypothetical protein
VVVEVADAIMVVVEVLVVIYVYQKQMFVHLLQ